MDTLGLDIGSVSLKLVLLSGEGEVRFQEWRRTSGRPVETARELLSLVIRTLGDERLSGVMVTGSGQSLLAQVLGVQRVNEIVAHATAAWTLHPEARSVIEIGGQDSKFIRIGRQADGRPFLEEHAFNDLCAAGTGAFLDQMASRLGLDVAELGRLAARAVHPARMSGRCAVFAKSDLIHLQQRACPPDEIAAGLCFALARNYLASVCRGQVPQPPVLFQGGVAANEGVLRAFRELLSLPEDALIRPAAYKVMGAIGAALIARDSPLEEPVLLTDLVGRLGQHVSDEEAAVVLDPLQMPPVTDTAPAPTTLGDGVYLGLDVGSVSTKVAVISGDGRLCASAYGPTAGRPIQAVEKALAEVLGKLPRMPKVLGAVTTGSGRHVALHLTRADEAVDEVTAQARYAREYAPEADTIIEIGGQDSKYIRMENGRVTRFAMNRACAAGTGSFLEEQASRLGLDIAKDFASAAFRSGSPASMGNRCTVFMDSDLVHYIQRGRPVEDLCAGLAYAVARNYLEKVVGSRPVGRRVLFQGGVARNRAVQAAFSAILGKEVLVPPHPELSGAMGAALLARDRGAMRQGPVLGLEVPLGKTATRTFECRGCENLCEVQEVTVVASEPRRAWFGSVCGRFERGEENPVPPDDAFAVRERLLLKDRSGSGAPHRGEIAFPMALTMHDHLPFWRTFFETLGFKVRLSPKTNREVTALGLARVPAEFCQPMKVLFGHVHTLVQSGAKRIFVPHERLFPAPGEDRAWFACPYTQAAPYVVRANLPQADVLTLEFPVQDEEGYFVKSAATALEVPEDEARNALKEGQAALAAFRSECLAEGERVLKGLERTGRLGAVLLGRPYNTGDRAINLHLARRLKGLSLEPIPMDFLPLDQEPLPAFWQRVRWGQGRSLLKAARIVRRDPRLVAVVVTNFGCGPDAFVDQYLEEVLADTPHIVLEFDDHQAEAGLLTRLEAFSRTVKRKSARPAGPFKDDQARPVWIATRPLREYTYYVPRFSDHAHAFVGALRGAGCRVHLLPPSDDESYELGLRHAYGRECHPYIALLGDLLRAARSPGFVPDEACFYGPSYMGPCLLPQYPTAMSLVLKRLGLEHVTLLNIADPPTMAELGRGYIARLVLGLLAIDRLHKWKVETEGYEQTPGEVARVHAQNLQAIEDALASGGFFNTLRQCVARFKRIPLRPDVGSRPKVGVAGDIYTRINPKANDHLYERLRAGGFEVWTSCMMIDVSWLGLEQWPYVMSRQGKRWAEVAAFPTLLFTKGIRRAIDAFFPASIRTPEEGHLKEVMEGSERYCSYWIDRILSLNINRFKELSDAGASGVLNVMCHNCMIGTVTAGLIPAMRRDMPNLEMATLVFESLQSTHNQNRLEAFMAQVRSRMGQV